MKLVISIITFFSIISALFAGNYTEFQLGDRLKILNSKKFSPLRVYIFIDASSCSVCNLNIEIIQKEVGDNNLDYKLFVNNANAVYAKELTADYEFYSEIIADEYSVYKDLYKIKQLPSLLITDNEGNLLYEEKLGASIDLTKIKELYKQYNVKSKIESNKHLTLQKDIFIKKNGEKITCPEFKEVLFNPIRNEYLITPNRNCNFMITDGDGTVAKTINLRNYANFNSKCYIGLYNLSWSVTDSIITIYLPNNLNRAEIQKYNISQDSLYQGYEFIIDTVGRRDRQYYEGFSLNENCFLMIFNINRSLNYKLSNDDKIIYMYNNLGKPIRNIGTPDSIYQNYSMSGFYQPALVAKDDSSFYVYEPSTSNIKLYSINGDLLSRINIELSDEYRIFKDNINLELSSKDYYKTANKSSILNELFYDKTSQNIILFYENKTYPENCEDPFDSRITNDSYISIYDRTGKKLIDNDIKLPNEFAKPFNINNDLLYVSDIIDKKLHISIYKLNY